VNLKDWFDRWEAFCIEYGFGDDDGTGHVVFSEEQKRSICNTDKTKFSTDGSDGGIGGRPANSVIISDTTRAGTGTNKSSLSNTLMCGSNAAGEPLPVHVMFSSDTQEENYSIDYCWIANFPRVQGVFGREDVHEYCTQLTVNDKGSSDCRVLNQCLTRYQERLYPDAADVPGKRLLYKIDGGPGQLDEESLAEKRARGIYLFPGVQNTTQVHQETDQNYGQFKSDVRWNIATLTADLVLEFSRQHSHHDEDPANCTAPTKTVSIGRDQYGLIAQVKMRTRSDDFQHCVLHFTMPSARART
jgi:hypothetical protein